MIYETDPQTRYREQTGGCQGGGVQEGMDWEFGISRCKVLYIAWINKVHLYNTGNCIQYPVINHNGKEYKEECIYVILNHFEVQHKLTL